MIEFVSAIGLIFILEGLPLFAMPDKWKRYLKNILSKDDRTLRITGIFSVLLGLVILSIVRQLS